MPWYFESFGVYIVLTCIIFVFWNTQKVKYFEKNIKYISWKVVFCNLSISSTYFGPFLMLFSKSWSTSFSVFPYIFKNGQNHSKYWKVIVKNQVAKFSFKNAFEKHRNFSELKTCFAYKAKMMPNSYITNLVFLRQERKNLEFLKWLCLIKKGNSFFHANFLGSGPIVWENQICDVRVIYRY